MSVKDSDFSIDFKFLDDLAKEEKEKFISLINKSNTRENTVEIQCAVYMKIIYSIMEGYSDFQIRLNDLLADLIILFEESNLEISVSANED